MVNGPVHVGHTDLHLTAGKHLIGVVQHIDIRDRISINLYGAAAVVCVIQDHQEQEGKDNVDERSCKGNRRASAHRLSHKVPFTGNLAFLERIGVFPRHRHIAAEGNRRNAVFGFSVAELDELFSEAYTKGIHLDIVPFGNQKVTEFVNGHEETQTDEAEDKHQGITENRFHHYPI